MTLTRIHLAGRINGFFGQNLESHDSIHLLMESFVDRTHSGTVLVEDRRGESYSDGKRYAKFYVPVQLLEAVE